MRNPKTCQAKCAVNAPCPTVQCLSTGQQKAAYYLATSSGCTSTKENTMMNMDNTETRQRNQMKDRLLEVADNHDSALRRAFHLTDDEFPANAEDFVQRIKDGKFVLRSQTDTWCGSHFMDRVRWRDPAAVADHEGFKLAEKRLEAAREALDDKISFLPVAESYAAFEAFKTMSFTK